MIADTPAMDPEEAAPILSDFADKLNLDMTGKFWAPSGSCSRSPVLRTPLQNAMLITCLDGARGIGNAEEVMGKEWASKPGPLELPW